MACPAPPALRAPPREADRPNVRSAAFVSCSKGPVKNGGRHARSGPCRERSATNAARPWQLVVNGWPRPCSLCCSRLGTRVASPAPPALHGPPRGADLLCPAAVASRPKRVGEERRRACSVRAPPREAATKAARPSQLHGLPHGILQPYFFFSSFSFARMPVCDKLQAWPHPHSEHKQKDGLLGPLGEQAET